MIYVDDLEQWQEEDSYYRKVIFTLDRDGWSCGVENAGHSFKSFGASMEEAAEYAWRELGGYTG